MDKSFGMAILAAGEGTRLRSGTPKPLIPLLGKSLIEYPLGAALGLQKQIHDLKIGIVLGHKRELVQDYLKNRYEKLCFAFQAKQQGTADALKCYFKDNPELKKTEYTFVVCADTPLIETEHLSALLEAVNKDSDLLGVAATVDMENPFGLGRIIRKDKGFKIIEEKDASSDIKKITEINSALYLLKTDFVLEGLEKIGNNNNSAEFYLTDLFQSNQNVKALKFSNSKDFLGLNTIEQWEECREELKKKKIKSLRENGVVFLSADQNLIDWDVEIGSGTKVYPGVVCEGTTKIGNNCCLESGSIIKNSEVSDEVVIKAYSYLDQAKVANQVSLGPFCHLRPESNIGENAKVGNFVEVKKSKLNKGAKVSHLSYVGDAEIGSESNIGCGFITCNYDGKNKNKTIVGSKTFIGSDCQTIAPVEIGDNAFIAAGSTITKNVPDGAFSVARERQVVKEGMAKKFLKNKD